jgi:phosphatidylserine/phosphatidylglycerophosphate/cardiolipin synthase-like enzyme
MSQTGSVNRDSVQINFSQRMVALGSKKEKNQQEFQLKEVLLIDHLWVYTIKKRVGIRKLVIFTNNREMRLQFEIPQFKSWIKRINYAVNHSPWSYRLDRIVESSFAPMRRDNRIRLMIDGEMYFRNLAEELSRAQSEIFITDWWMCPKYFLVRPVSLASVDDKEKFRLDCLLYKAAMRGVKVYIIHWKESKFAVTFNSSITQEYLMGLHPNIKMLRHTSDGIRLWSHHAKIVVID